MDDGKGTGMTTKVQKSISVSAPISVVYNQWTQFEEFPEFMGGVKEVRQLDNERLHWVAEIAGVKREWNATILEQVPDEKIAWAATQGATNAGAVHFTSISPTETSVRLSLEYEPEGLVEKAGDKLKIVEKQAESDLEKFKDLMEARGAESGGWRGAVDPGGSVGTPGVEAAESSKGDSGKVGLSAKVVAAGVAAGAAGVAAAAVVKATKGSPESNSESSSESSSDVSAEDTEEFIVPAAGSLTTANTHDAVEPVDPDDPLDVQGRPL